MALHCGKSAVSPLATKINKATNDRFMEQVKTIQAYLLALHIAIWRLYGLHFTDAPRHKTKVLC